MAYTYGCKLSYRMTSLDALRARFIQSIQNQFRRRHLSLHTAYVDLAYEDVLFEMGGEGGDGPLVLVRKSAYNEADMATLGLLRVAEYYQWHGTTDGGSARAEPGVKADVRAGGLAYVQAYMTEKDV